MIDRRLTLAVMVALILLAAPIGAGAQQAGRVPRVGVVATAPSVYWEAFEQALSELGYVQNRNIVLEYRFSQGRLERFPDLVSDVVGRRVDVLVAVSEPAARAAKQATTTIPIVMGVADDPVESGLVASFARPDGNITGTTLFQPELVGKRLQLLKEIVPRLSHVAVLGHATEPMVARAFKEAEKSAAALQLTVHSYKVGEPTELEGAFAEIARARPGGLLVLQNALTFQNRVKIAELAAQSRVPAVYGVKDAVVSGGLISYGPDFRWAYVRHAAYVDKILKGAKPADLPVERVATFELVINVKTAKALGLTFPQSILLRTDQIIE